MSTCDATHGVRNVCEELRRQNIQSADQIGGGKLFDPEQLKCFLIQNEGLSKEERAKLLRNIRKEEVPFKGEDGRYIVEVNRALEPCGRGERELVLFLSTHTRGTSCRFSNDSVSFQ